MHGLLGLENIWQLFENLKSEGEKKKKNFLYINSINVFLKTVEPALFPYSRVHRF